MLRPLVGRPLPGDPVTMIAPAGGGAAAGAGALPGDAQVCSCHGVTKDAICAAITGQGLTDVAGVKAATRAGTGCGSCVPLLKTLLADSGVAVEPGAVRALRRHPRPALRHRPGERDHHLHRADRTARPRPGMRHLQAGGRLHPGQPRARPHPRRRAGGAAGHQRPLPGQHPAQRHLLGRAADPRRRGHAGQAHRPRRGRPRLRPVHEDHRRAAHRPARRAGGAAAGDLAAAGGRRIRVRARLRQGASGR